MIRINIVQGSFVKVALIDSKLPIAYGVIPKPLDPCDVAQGNHKSHQCEEPPSR